MTREEIIKSMSLQDAIQVLKDTNCYGTMDIAKSVILKALEQEPRKGQLTNSEWIDFLSEQFDISRTSAKEILHVMMLVKKEDNFKKQFSGRK